MVLTEEMVQFGHVLTEPNRASLAELVSTLLTYNKPSTFLSIVFGLYSSLIVATAWK